MKGKHKIVVSTKRLKYEFELHRNLTVIRGDSATGKTTLVDMIRDHINNPSGTPVELVCDKTCYVLEENLWKAQLSEISDVCIKRKMRTGKPVPQLHVKNGCAGIWSGVCV